MFKPRIAIPVVSSNNHEYAEKATPQYCLAVEQAGGIPVQIRLDLDNHEIMRVARSCEGVLLPGSRADVNPEKYGEPRDPKTHDADPARDNVDELLLQDAYNMHKPILGICFGTQILNVWRTGTLVQHLDTGLRHSGMRENPAPPHMAQVESLSKLAGIIESATGKEPASPQNKLEIEVNTSHHQALGEVGDGLRVVARATDNTIEAVEGTAADHFVLGVQWHPERPIGPEADLISRAIFQAFIDASRQRHEQPRTPNPDFESLEK
jgi:putative glutamine amidotransferase